MFPSTPESPASPEDQLLAALKPKLETLLKDHVESDVDPEKVAQFRMARRNQLYFEGKQSLVPVWANGIADFSPTGAPIAQGKEELGQFDYNFNFIRGDGLKAISVTGKAPKCDAVPDDPEDDQAITTSQDANAVAAHFCEQWKADQVQKDIMFVLWTFGPAFIYTRYVANGQKNGYHEEPEMGTEDVALAEGGYECNNCGLFTPSEDIGSILCPQCDSPATSYQPPITAPVPVQIGTKRYQKGTVELDVCDIFTVTTQFDAKDISKVQYLRYEYEAPKGALIELFGEKLRKKLESNSDPGGGSNAASQVGEMARGTANSPTGIRYYRKDRWRFTRDWLLPSMYEYVDDRPTREALLRNFPEGVKISSVDGEPQKLDSEKLTDYWAACPPSVGKRLHGDPLCADSIPGQDLYNDGQAMAAETEYHGIPATVVDNQIFDKEAMENRPPNPAELIFANLQGQDPHKLMASLPVATFSEQLLPWLQGVREDMRDISGTNKAIAGLEGATQTAEEARLRQNAALKQLSVSYDNTRYLWPQFLMNACREASRYGIGKVKSPVSQGLLGYQSRSVDLAKFAFNGVHFEVDEGMPASFGEERDRIMDMLKNAPFIATLSGLDNPYNSAALNKYIGVRGLYDPKANERIYVKRTIDRLLKEKKVPGPIGPDGMPSFQPSIPIRQFEDNHANCAAMVQVWASTPDGLEQMEVNREGYDNVIAWGVAQGTATPPDAPPDDAGGPPKPKGKGPDGPALPGSGVPPPMPQPSMPQPGTQLVQ